MRPPPTLPRRKFLRLLGAGSGLPALLRRSQADASIKTSECSAAPVETFASFDHEMIGYMEKRGTPGGALAVIRNGRLLYAQGYGWADRDARTPATPDALFRVASLSKPITAVAVAKLTESGKLALDAPAVEYLPRPLRDAMAHAPDSRVRSVTLRQLLQHTGGWDRAARFDPMFRSRPIAAWAGTASPPDVGAIIRYMAEQPLDFEPGSRYAYSNFGYCLIGRIIEEASGGSYETWTQTNVLAPAGARSMRLGRSLEGHRAAGEVRYYTAGDQLTESVFDEDKDRVHQAYGGFCLEAMDSHGGWLASALDLARFAAALEPGHPQALLSSSTLETVYAPPPPPVSRDDHGGIKPFYYGLGWLVRPIGAGGRANYWHNGSLPGTYALLVRRWDGLAWVALFNQRSGDPALPDASIDPALHRAAAKVAEWPEGVPLRS